VSNAKARELETTLQHLGLTPLFDAIISRDAIQPNKPDPAPYIFGAKTLGVPIEDCIAIEDSPPGLEAALKSGIPTIAVCTTFGPETVRYPVKDRKDLTPFRIDPNIQAVFAWLKQLPNGKIP
jgi:beta-phosphoglucomutase-like phosphatase (HAD superfamily)